MTPERQTESLSPESLLSEAEQRPKLFDSENVLSRIDVLEWLQEHSPYVHLPQHDSYWSRVTRALEHIPARYRDPAIALFSRVVYLDAKLLDALTRQIVHDAGEWCRGNGVTNCVDETFIFGLDHVDFIKSFYDFGATFGWEGRVDNKLQGKIQTVTQLLDRLGDCVHGHEATITNLRELFRKKVWIITTDNALGGGSAASELKKINALIEMFGKDSAPKVVFATQTYSDYGASRLAGVIPADRVFYGIKFSDQWRISSDKCRLFTTGTLAQVKELCEWFGNECIDRKFTNDHEYPFLSSLRRHWESGKYNHNFAYGWGDSGFTVVTHKNSPNNSVPILWYPCKGEKMPPASHDLFSTESDILSQYPPPFPRQNSRKRQNQAGDQDRIKALQHVRVEINRLLWT